MIFDFKDHSIVFNCYYIQYIKTIVLNAFYKLMQQNHVTLSFNRANYTHITTTTIIKKLNQKQKNTLYKHFRMC